MLCVQSQAFSAFDLLLQAGALHLPHLNRPKVVLISISIWISVLVLSSPPPSTPGNQLARTQTYSHGKTSQPQISSTPQAAPSTSAPSHTVPRHAPPGNYPYTYPLVFATNGNQFPQDSQPPTPSHWLGSSYIRVSSSRHRIVRLCSRGKRTRWRMFGRRR